MFWRVWEWLVVRWERATCQHHWHAADAMIRIVCCWCAADGDGWPYDRTARCAWAEDGIDG